ncbi:MAG: RNA polymerase sigma factor [FCB group bacterium]|nr:RNA polymerase sigma factor [FCB group bacterium]
MDRELFWTLLEPEHAKAEAFCRKLEQNREDGDDLYQDSLVLALRKFDSLRERGSFRPWLYRIIVNGHKNRHRLSWWRHRATLTPGILETRFAHDPSGQLTARRWLERAFEALNPGEQALITLFDLENWSVAELAALYRVAEGTIKARLSRSRRKMRQKLKRYLSRQESTNQLKEAEYALPRSKTADG